MSIVVSSPSARLLVVDDEPNIAELLEASLRYSGFDVTVAADGAEALTKLTSEKFDLVVLDVMMPTMDGFEVVKRLRHAGNHTPVLFLTASDGVEEKVRGLTIGGDDYVVKPFSLQEVIARINSLLRRSRPQNARSAKPLRVADIELDEDSHEVTKGGKLISLSPTEFKLLHYFLSNPGRVLSKAKILDHVWQYDFGGDGNVVESYMSYLRKKVDTTEPRLIHTIRGVGYIMREPKTER